MRVQVSEQLRQGHSGALLTEAKEAAEAATTHAQAEAQHLQQRISHLTTHVQARPFLGPAGLTARACCQLVVWALRTDCRLLPDHLCLPELRKWCGCTWECAGPG